MKGIKKTEILDPHKNLQGHFAKSLKGFTTEFKGWEQKLKTREWLAEPKVLPLLSPFWAWRMTSRY